VKLWQTTKNCYNGSVFNSGDFAMSEDQTASKQQPEGRDFDHYKSVEAKREARDKTEKALHEAAAAHSEADTEYVKARTETYDGELVSKARDLGINPDNFATEEALEGAVDTVETIEQNRKDDEKIARGESLSTVE
jgi:hypothetical protein